MHIILDEDVRGPAPGDTKAFRTKMEKRNKRINTLVLLAQFTCFLIMLTQISTRSEKTFRGDPWYPAQERFDLTVQLQTQLANCTHTAVIMRGGWEIEYTIGLQNSTVLMADCAGRIRVAILVNAFAIVAGSMNKIMYDLNVHYITKLGRLKVRKQLLLMIEFVLIVWAIVAMEALEDMAKFLHDWTTKCNVKFQTIFSVPPFIAMYVGHGIVLLAYLVNWFMLLQNAYKRPEELEDEANREMAARGQLPSANPSQGQYPGYAPDNNFV